MRAVPPTGKEVAGLLPDDGLLAEIILERADRILTKDGGRQCERPLTHAEIDSLPACDDPQDAA